MSESIIEKIREQTDEDFEIILGVVESAVSSNSIGACNDNPDLLRLMDSLARMTRQALLSVAIGAFDAERVELTSIAVAAHIAEIYKLGKEHGRREVELERTYRVAGEIDGDSAE